MMEVGDVVGTAFLQHHPKTTVRPRQVVRVHASGLASQLSIVAPTEHLNWRVFGNLPKYIIFGRFNKVRNGEEEYDGHRGRSEICWKFFVFTLENFFVEVSPMIFYYKLHCQMGYAFGIVLENIFWIEIRSWKRNFALNKLSLVAYLWGATAALTMEHAQINGPFVFQPLKGVQAKCRAIVAFASHHAVRLDVLVGNELFRYDVVQIPFERVAL